MYTASWRNLYRFEREHGEDSLPVFPIRVSATAPRYWQRSSVITAVQELIPPKALVRLEGEEFAQGYLQHLNQIGVDPILERLREITLTTNQPLALACFEADPRTCHRGLFADFWFVTTGEVVEEWTFVPTLAQQGQSFAQAMQAWRKGEDDH
jgi:hypothetical protein